MNINTSNKIPNYCLPVLVLAIFQQAALDARKSEEARSWVMNTGVRWLDALGIEYSEREIAAAMRLRRKKTIPEKCAEELNNTWRELESLS